MINDTLARTQALALRKPSWLGRELIAFALLLVLGTALLLAQTSMVASTGYKVDGLEGTKERLLRENRILEAEVASLRSLSRVDKEARERLKMETPKSYVYLTVDTLPKHPTPLLKKALGQGIEVTTQASAEPWWQPLASLVARIKAGQ